MKKHWLFALAILLLALAPLSPAICADASEVIASGSRDQISWVLTEDGTLTLSGTGTVYGAEFFPDQNQILRAELREGITGIYDEAFRNMTALTSVSLPDSLTNLGFRTFSGCTALEQIRIPAGVTNISGLVFEGCTALKTVELENGLETIYLDVFSGCTALEQIRFPDTLVSIGDYAFSNCTALKQISFPESLVTVGSYAFSGCTALTQVTAPAKLPTVGHNTFHGTPFLASLTDSSGFSVWGGQLLEYSGTSTAPVLPDSVTEIADGTFRDTPITAVTLPDTLKRIGAGAFYNCDGLTSVTIPESVTEVGIHAFHYCAALTQVQYADPAIFSHPPFYGTPFAQANTDDRGFFVLDGVLMDYSGDGGEIRIPDTVRSIPAYVFRENKKVTAVTVPGTVERIEAEAFLGASDHWGRSASPLTSVTLEPGVREIGDGAFRNCGSLTDLVLPETLTVIGSDAFRDCTKLTGLVLPEGLETVSSGAFAGCGLTSVDLPASLLHLGDEAFQGCRLTCVTGMEGIRSIGDRAFYDNPLSQIRLPVTLESLGESVFFSLENLIYDGSFRQFSQIKIGKNNRALYYSQLQTQSPTPFRGNCVNDYRYSNILAAGTLPTAFAKIDGGYMLAERSFTGSIMAAKYDENYQLLAAWEILPELPLFGGIYLDNDYHFVVTGQTNKQEDDSLEVIRITRYSSDWQKIDHVSISGIRTRVPFDWGSLRFVRSGDHLFLRTSRERYKDDLGVAHQTSLMLHLRISDMTLLEDLSGPTRPSEGYVSHSFDQYLLLDGDTLLASDLGDHTPRSIPLIRFRSSVGSDTLAGKAQTLDLFPIAGIKGDNYTGVRMGGLECSDTHYFVAGASVSQDPQTWDPDGPKNIFVTAVPKTDLTSDAARIHWITDYTAEDHITFPIIHLVQLDGQRTMLMWTEIDRTGYSTKGLLCCILGPDGAPITEIYRHDIPMNPCTPIYDGKNVIWFTTGTVTDWGIIDSYPVFFSLDPEDLSVITTHCPNHLYIGGVCIACGHEDPCAQGHSYADATCNAPQTCTVCGTTLGEPLGHRYENGSCVLCGRSEKGLPGDADGNGAVNYRDALLVLRHSIGLDSVPFPEDADVDGNPGLSYQDALLILRFSIGLVPQLPVSK